MTFTAAAARFWIGSFVFIALGACTTQSAPANLTWHNVDSPHLKPGARIAFLQGTFETPGALVFRLSLPANYEFPAHFHDTDEELVVISGSVYMGGMDGRPMDKSAGVLHRKGARHPLPAKTIHWAVTPDEPAIAEVRSTGPYVIHWVHDAAAPR